MNELITIGNRNIGGETVQTVNARELHSFLESGKDFSNWIKDRISQYDFTEGRDFVCSPVQASKRRGGHNALDYHISIDMGKELAMVERNSKGKEARTYFIACEKRALSIPPELQIAHALVLATKMIEQKDAMIAEMAPKAEFFDAVTGSPTAVSMAVAAKTLNMGLGRNRIFELLRSKGILDKNNIPLQRYCDSGYFRVIESPFKKPDGTVCISFSTVVYQKGMDFIRKQLLAVKG